MVIAADTSFLFSLYGADIHTARAREWISLHESAVHLTVLNRFEFHNAMRLAVFRAVSSQERRLHSTALFDDAVRQGRLVFSDCELMSVIQEASRLSVNHTLTGGHRAFDILHVASALCFGATHFLTFDANQKALAEKEGLIVPL